MQEAFYTFSTIAFLGLFFWGPIYRRVLADRPRAALITRYLFVVSGVFTLWSIVSIIGWGLIRENVMPGASPFIWGSIPSSVFTLAVAVFVSVLALPPARARAIETAMVEKAPPDADALPPEPHWTDGLRWYEQIGVIVASVVGALFQLGWYALIAAIGVAVLAIAYIALQGLSDVSVPQAVLIGAIIIAAAIYISNRR
jgi:hypothetical protein